MLISIFFWILMLQLFHGSETILTCPNMTLTSLHSLNPTQFTGGSIAYHNYSYNVSCCWKIPAQIGYEIHVVFHDFSIESASYFTKECDYDNLTLTWINSKGSWNSKTVCGSRIPNPIIASRNLTVTFKSDSSQNGLGFHIGFYYLSMEKLTTFTDTKTAFSTTKTISQYFTSPWKVPNGSTASISSFYQSSNLVVTCSTEYGKEKNISIILDGKVLSTSKNTIEKQFSFDLHSTIMCDLTSFNGKLIMCQTENQWGKEEKSIPLTIEYEVKLVGLKSNNSYLVLNQNYPDIKCETMFSGLSCKIRLLKDNSTIVQTKTGVLFKKEGANLIKCTCGKMEDIKYCSAPWQVHIGSNAPITSFYQSSNFVVNCSTNYRKAKNVSILLDGNVLATSINTIERHFSFNLESKINCNPEDFNEKMILVRMENEWGKQEKSFALNIHYNPKPKQIAINGQYGDIVSVDVGTNVTCTCGFGNPKPKRITFIKSKDGKFRSIENQLVPKHEGNYNVTCRVELENGNSVSKVFHLKVVDHAPKGISIILIALIASASGNLLLIIFIAATHSRRCGKRNKNKHNKMNQNSEILAQMNAVYEVCAPRELPNPPRFENNVLISEDNSSVKYINVDPYNSPYELDSNGMDLLN